MTEYNAKCDWVGWPVGLPENERTFLREKVKALLLEGTPLSTYEAYHRLTNRATAEERLANPYFFKAASYDFLLCSVDRALRCYGLQKWVISPEELTREKERIEKAAFSASFKSLTKAQREALKKIESSGRIPKGTRSDVVQKLWNYELIVSKGNHGFWIRLTDKGTIALHGSLPTDQTALSAPTQANQ